MTPRVATALLLAALAVWLGVARPAARERDDARAAYASAREERERLRARLGALERSAAALRETGAGSDAARALRRALLRATEGLDLADVQVATGGGRASRGATGRLAVTGHLRDVLRASERLAAPGSGVRIERVALTDVRDGDARAVRLELEAGSAGGLP